MSLESPLYFLKVQIALINCVCTILFQIFQVSTFFKALSWLLYVIFSCFSQRDIFNEFFFDVNLNSNVFFSNKSEFGPSNNFFYHYFLDTSVFFNMNSLADAIPLCNNTAMTHETVIQAPIVFILEFARWAFMPKNLLSLRCVCLVVAFICFSSLTSTSLRKTCKQGRSGPTDYKKHRICRGDTDTNVEIWIWFIILFILLCNTYKASTCFWEMPSCNPHRRSQNPPLWKSPIVCKNRDHRYVKRHHFSGYGFKLCFLRPMQSVQHS